MTKTELEQMELKTIKNPNAIKNNQVFGKIKGKTGYTSFEDFEVNGIQISKVINDILVNYAQSVEKIETLKTVILNQQKDIERISLILQKYGLE